MGRKRTVTDEAEITEAVAYIRVSTQDQADSGLGMEAQKARIAAYCTAQGWHLAETFTDAGLSAKTLNRPGLQAAILSLRPGRVLVGLKLDRLTRTARDLDELTALVHGRAGEWATVEGNYDTSTAMGRFMLRVVADIAQMEREVTAERTSAALQAKKTRGERLGTTPLGFRTVETPEGRRVEADPEEQKTVDLARELRAGGLSLRAIAARLTEAGRRTKRGGRWQAETISYMLAPRYLEELAAA